MKIISNSKGKFLALNIAKRIDAKPANILFSKFPNGEKKVQILENLKGEKIITVLDIAPPVDENIIESLLLLDALERQKVAEIILIIPWLGYSLQDRVFRMGEPLSSKVIAGLFNHKTIKKIILLDIHKKAILGYFKRPVVNKSAVRLFSNIILREYGIKSGIVVSTDHGGINLAIKLSNILKLPMVSTKKVRNLNNGLIEKVEISPKVKGKNVFIIDDGILSGQTILNVAHAIKANGGRSIHCFATHPVFTKGAIRTIENSGINSLVVTNSIYHKNYPKNCKVIDCSELFI
jgi:ribose-phosphate pyrophosphokinase